MTSSPTRPGVSRWWRALSITLLIVLSIGLAATSSLYVQLQAHIGHLQNKLSQLPQIRQLAVLLDQDQKPAMLITFDPASQRLQLERLNAVKEGREDSMQLWAVREGQAPQSLGVVESKFKAIDMTATAQQLQGAASLAISVENKGGVPNEQGPRLPWLFIGALVNKAM
jgi:anti-sigma-K factor RskA